MGSEVHKKPSLATSSQTTPGGWALQIKSEGEVRLLLWLVRQKPGFTDEFLERNDGIDFHIEVTPLFQEGGHPSGLAALFK